MGIEYEDFCKLISQKFPEARFSLKASINDNEHYELEIASSRFTGLSLLKQHQLVYNELGIMHDTLHALSLKTKPITN